MADSEPSSIGDPLPIHQDVLVGSVNNQVLHITPCQVSATTTKKNTNRARIFLLTALLNIPSNP